MNDNSKKTILLVEDEIIIAMVEARELERHGYPVIMANSAMEAIEAVRNNPGIDLVLMDIDLGGGMDGTVAAEAILRDREIPVVFLSSHAEPEIVEKTERITSYGYVMKNSGERVLLTSIKMAIRLFDAHRRIDIQSRDLEESNEEMQSTIVELEAANRELLRSRDELLKKESDLADSREEFRGYFNMSTVGMCVTSVGKRWIEVNNRLSSMLGYSKEELAGLTWAELTHPEDLDADVALFNRLLGGQIEEYELEKRFIRKDGSIINTMLYVTCKRNADRSVRHVLASLLDITERTKIEAETRAKGEVTRKILDAILDPGDEIGGSELADVIDHAVLQSLMDDLYRVTNIGVGITDMKGRVLVATGWQEVCAKFHRAHPRALADCIESVTVLSGGVAPGEYRLHRCRNGMREMVTPIMLDGRHAGNLFLCQFFFDDEEPDTEYFRSQARVCGFDENEYLNAVCRAPCWSRKTVEAVMDFYAKFAGMVSSLSQSNFALARALGEKEELLVGIREREERIEFRERGLGLLLDLHRLMDAPRKELMEFALDALTRMTSSGLSFIGIVGEDDNITIHPWSDDPTLMEMAYGKVMRFTPENSGIWGRCIEGRKNLIENNYDYAASGEPEYPAHHVRIHSIMAVPIMDGARVVALGAVANGRSPYQKQDVGVMVAFLDRLWGMLRRRAAEEALRESEARYRALFDSAMDCVYVHDLEGNFIDANETALGLLGYGRDEIGSVHFSTLIGEDQLEKALSTMKEIIATGNQKAPTVYRLRGKHGAEVYVETVGSPLFRNGEPRAIISMARDITERRRAEMALRESEGKYRALVESTLLGVGVSREERIIYANRALLDMFGCDTLEELSRKSLLEHAAPESRQLIKERLDMLRRGEIPGPDFTHDIIRRDGSRRTLNLSVSTVMINGEACRQSTFIDITDRMHSEEALRENEKKYRAIVENAGEAVVVAQEGRLVFANRMAEVLSGYSQEDLMSRSFTELIHPDEREMVAGNFARRLKKETVPDVYSFRLLRKDGTVRWIELRGAGITWEEMPATINMITDITERRRAEDALRESEHRYRTLFETMAQGVVYHDADGVIVSANPAAEKMLGLTLVQMQGRTSFDPRRHIIRDDGSDFPGEEHPAMEALRSGREVRDVVMGVYHPVEDNYCWIIVSATPEFLEGATRPFRVFASFTDITERKRVEETLKKTSEEKEVLLRELQHRVKNNLVLVSSLLSLEAGGLPDGRAREVLIRTQSRVQSMSVLYEQLYRAPVGRLVDLAHYIRSLAVSIVDTYEAESGNVRLQTSLAGVELDARKSVPLGLILNELVTNAMKYAYPPGRSGELRIALEKNADSVTLSVSDDGPGRPAGSDGSGGMGLRLVGMLAKQIGGELCFESGPGTTVRVTFEAGFGN